VYPRGGIENKSTVTVTYAFYAFYAFYALGGLFSVTVTVIVTASRVTVAARRRLAPRLCMKTSLFTWHCGLCGGYFEFCLLKKIEIKKAIQ
jgi:hypothetical protein